MSALAEAEHVRIVAAGHPGALSELDWPSAAVLVPVAGWQRADMALAGLYTVDEEPLVLVSGDGDFGLLADRHPGPVLVVSGAPSSRLRAGATVTDPLLDDATTLRTWLTTCAQNSGATGP